MEDLHHQMEQTWEQGEYLRTRMAYNLHSTSTTICSFVYTFISTGVLGEYEKKERYIIFYFVFLPISSGLFFANRIWCRGG